MKDTKPVYRVKKHRNGYELNVDGRDYYYFSVTKLLEGIDVHVIERINKPIKYN